MRRDGSAPPLARASVALASRPLEASLDSWAPSGQAADRRPSFLELGEPVGLVEQAEKEAMARMELAKQCSLFLGIHF